MTGGPDGRGGPRSDIVHAAGAVVWRERRERLEVLLVHRPRYRDWSWPKGKLDPGESVPAAAVREVAEETGEAVVLGVPLPGRRYTMPDGRSKQVRYWAARPVDERGGPALAARGPVQPAALTEIDDVVWVSASTAAELLTRTSDRGPLDAAVALWSRGRLATRLTALVRHGKARPRSGWHDGEASRPLTEAGRAQAAGLVPVLAAFGIRELVSSPWERCLSTVEPYATLAGVEIERVAALTEAAHREDPSSAVQTVADHVSRPRDAALSMHRPVLPTALDTLAEATRRWTVGRLPAADPYLRPGDILVAHLTGTGPRARVVAVEHHRPPPAALAPPTAPLISQPHPTVVSR